MSQLLSGMANAIPSLSTLYSGVPERLTQEAIAAKQRLFSNKTDYNASDENDTKYPLPPDIDQATFDKAIAQLRNELGEENVELNDKDRLEDGWYMEHPNTHDAFHILSQRDLLPSAIVYPSITAEVQLIVRWANQYLIPIYPISMGRNLGYGGAAPRLRGSVVVDLGRRMDKVLNIDGENASCVVEPGVSYFKLYEEVQNRGFGRGSEKELWIDCPDLGGGSVLGNAVDRGVGYTPYGDHFSQHCGMELVLPDGSLLRTGLGALPGPNNSDNPCWQSFPHAYGPSIDGLFSQSNYGIVTKMGFFLMPAPPHHQSYMLTFPKEEDFEQIVEIIRPLAQRGVLGNIPQLRHVIQELAVTGRPRSDFYTGEGTMPRSVVREYASREICGDCSWVFYGTQYSGTLEDISRQLDLIKSEFSKVEGMKFFLPKDVPEEHYLHSRALVNAGVPILRELDWLNWVPNAAHLFFSPILPTRGRDAKIVMNLVRALHEKYGFDLFPTMCIAGREMHTIVNIVYDRSSPEQKSRAIAVMREMIDEAAKLGYGEYRTHLIFADQVAGSYNWGGGALGRFNEVIKDAVDPNGIMAPGRCGIWGKRWRGRGYEMGVEMGQTQAKDEKAESGVVLEKSRL